MDRFCILLTSVGRRSYLVRYFKQALAGRGMVVATNSHADTTGMLAADHAVVIPSAGEDGFVDQLLAVCRRFQVKMLCSLHDWEAPFISSARDEFLALGVIPVVSGLSVLDICLDKHATFKFGLREGIRVPKTALGLVAALQQCTDEQLEFPLVLKPRWGQGSIGTEKVFAEDELRAACVLTQRTISRMESNGLLRKQGEENVVIQEWIDGTEYGLDIVNDLRGRFAVCFVKRKLGMRSGETDAAETVDCPVLESFGRLIGERLGHIGMLDADVVLDRHGPCLLDLNPRFGGHYPFAHEAGADIPRALIAWAEGREPAPTWLRVKHGVRSFKDITMLQAQRSVCADRSCMNKGGGV